MRLIPHHERGFSLLELLVALVVLSVGLLGSAAMLLDSLRTETSAMHRLAAVQIAQDMANRIRANPLARAHYDTRDASLAADCAGAAACDPAQRAAADVARFVAVAREQFAPSTFSASVVFAPAIGPAAPDRYEISLRWRDTRDVTGEEDTVALQVLAQSPVAG